MQSLTERVFIPFIIFVTLFFGTGFIAGSIIHMGEGINPWDLGLFSVGIVLFVAGSVALDIRQGRKRLLEEGLAMFLLLSMFLSIGIGMASGGIQHFDDTPVYSAILIPIGIGLGLIAYILKEHIILSRKEWMTLLPLTVLGMVLLSIVLKLVGSALPKSLLSNHSHTSNQAFDSVPSTFTVDKDDPHHHAEP